MIPFFKRVGFIDQSNTPTQYKEFWDFNSRDNPCSEEIVDYLNQLKNSQKDPLGHSDDNKDDKDHKDD
jgi:hypothetical protein